MQYILYTTLRLDTHNFLYKSYVIAIFLLFFATKNFAQTPNCQYQISGKVVAIHTHTEENLASATLWITELKRSVQTDRNGNFIIKDLCEGDYTLVCSYIGCDTHTKHIVLNKNTQEKKLNIHIKLNVATQNLHEVEIQAQKTVQTDVEIQATQTLSNQELAATRGLSLGESLKKITGVTTLNTGNNIAKPMIQGMHSNRVLVMNSGVRQEGQQWGAEHAPEIDPFVASQLSVIKGAASVRYGADAMGGVVLVEPKPLQKNPLLGGELNLVGASNGRQGVVSGIVEGTVKSSLFWRLQGTLKKSGTIQTPNYYLRNTGFEETNFSYNLGYLKEKFGVEIFYSQFNTSVGIFTGSHFGNLTDLQYILTQKEPDETHKGNFSYQMERPFQRIEHELFKAKMFLKTNNLGKFSLTFARQFNYRAEFDSHGISAANNPNSPQMALKITTYTTELILEHKPIRNFFGTLGAFAMYQDNTYSGNFFIPFFRNYQAALFAVEHWEKNKWLLEAGLRYDYRHLEADLNQNPTIQKPEYPTFDFHNLSASTGAKYTLNNYFYIGVNGAMAFRTPSVNELFSNGVHHGAASMEIGNRNLKTETAYNLSANLNFYSQKLKVQLNGYHNFIQNYIYLQPSKPETLTIRGAFPTFRYQQADVIIKGIDLSATYQLTKQLSYQGKFAFLRAYNYSADDYLILMPPDRYENALRYEWNGKKNIKDNYLAISTLSVANQWRVPENTDYAPPPTGYTLLNFEAGTTIKSKKFDFQIGLSVNNILNTAYRDYLNRFRYFADEMGRNIMLKIKIPFVIRENK
jgi:iron complex outermembrane receptor protein